jgi:endonuclease-3 related protein
MVAGIEHGSPRDLDQLKQKPRQGSAERLRRMHDLLVATYGPQSWWPAQTPFEVILGAYLTQNTAWRAVERSLENLRAAAALSFEGLRALSVDELQELIRPSGFATRKAHALKAFVSMVETEFAGSLEILAAAPTAQLRVRLLDLPGVGPETADAILLYALGHPVPMADEYLRRIVERHRLLDPTPGRNRRGYDALVALTTRTFAGDHEQGRAQLFNEFHALTVAVGKAHCGRTARCGGCPLAGDLELAGISPERPSDRT